MSVHEKLVYAVSMVLRDRREILDISQSDLARKSGLHRSYIGDLERGSRNLSLKNLSRLSTALELVPSKLLALAEKKLAGNDLERPKKAASKVMVARATKTAKTAKTAKTIKTKKVSKLAKPAKSVKLAKPTKAVAKKAVKAVKVASTSTKKTVVAKKAVRAKAK